MASGIARGCVHMMAVAVAMELPKMASILQLIGWKRHAALVYMYNVLWYWTSMWWSIDTCQNKVSADHITWPYRGLTFRAHQDRVVFWSWPPTKCWFSNGSRAHVWLTCCKQGPVVRKPVNANPGLKVNRSIKCFSVLLFCVFWDCWNSKQKAK